MIFGYISNHHCQKMQSWARHQYYGLLHNIVKIISLLIPRFVMSFVDIFFYSSDYLKSFLDLVYLLFLINSETLLIPKRSRLRIQDVYKWGQNNQAHKLTIIN